MRTPAGIFMSDVQKQIYCIPALTLDDQIDLLTERGLNVPNRDKARHYLRYTGYYRLSGYFLALQQHGSDVQPHTFMEGITFNDVLDIYIFDRELRLLVIDAIERIEVAFRACISNTMSENNGPLWFMYPTHCTAFQACRVSGEGKARKKCFSIAAPPECRRAVFHLVT